MTKFGVHAGPQMCTMDELQSVWRTAEQLGFDWVSGWDHFYPAPTPLDGDNFEAVACHAALAALTTRPRVGCLVYSAGYRHPAVLANAGVTIDHISKGRLELGIGAGWHLWEYEAYGIPFEPTPVRIRRMAEAVQIVRLLWTEETTDFDGEFWTLREARCNPKPLQSEPRIWIGASGEKLALPAVGRLADGWNVFFPSPEDFVRKLSIVRESSPDPGRIAVSVNLGFLMADEANIEDAVRKRFGSNEGRATPGILTGSAARITDKIGQYVEAGAEWVILALRAPFDLDSLHAFAAEVMPAFTASPT